MKASTSRRKEPEIVRRALLDAASRIAARDGFAAVTLQTVASAASVTKGGLFHHFANKQCLIDSMIDEQIQQFEKEIQEHIDCDGLPRGRFTRAYVSTVLDWKIFVAGSVWGAMASHAASDQTMRGMWSKWMSRQLEHHRETDDDLFFQSIRYAADGAWLSYLIDKNLTETKVESFKNYLLDQTRK